VVSIEMVFEFTRPVSLDSDEYYQLAKKGVAEMQQFLQHHSNGSQDVDNQISVTVQKLMRTNSRSQYNNFVMTQVMSVDHDAPDDGSASQPVQPHFPCQHAPIADDETAVAQRVMSVDDIWDYNEGLTDADRILSNEPSVPVDDVTEQALDDNPDYDSDDYRVEDLVDWGQEVEREYGPIVNTVSLRQSDLTVDGISVDVRNAGEAGKSRGRRGRKTENKKKEK